MATPLLNEAMIIETLSLPVSADTAPTLCVAAMLSILDGYDREMTRDQYGIIVDAVCKFHDLIGRIAIVNAVRHTMGTADPTVADNLAKAGAELMARAEMTRKQILSKMQLLAECPLDEDPIH